MVRQQLTRRHIDHADVLEQYRDFHALGQFPGQALGTSRVLLALDSGQGLQHGRVPALGQHAHAAQVASRQVHVVVEPRELRREVDAADRVQRQGRLAPGRGHGGLGQFLDPRGAGRKQRQFAAYLPGRRAHQGFHRADRAPLGGHVEGGALAPGAAALAHGAPIGLAVCVTEALVDGRAEGRDAGDALRDDHAVGVELKFRLQAVLAVVPVHEGLGGHAPVTGPLDRGLAGRHAAGVPVVYRSAGLEGCRFGGGCLRDGRFGRIALAGLQQQGGKGQPKDGRQATKIHVVFPDCVTATSE